MHSESRSKSWIKLQWSSQKQYWLVAFACLYQWHSSCLFFPMSFAVSIKKINRTVCWLNANKGLESAYIQWRKKVCVQSICPHGPRAHMSRVAVVCFANLRFRLLLPLLCCKPSVSYALAIYCLIEYPWLNALAPGHPSNISRLNRAWWKESNGGATSICLIKAELRTPNGMKRVQTELRASVDWGHGPSRATGTNCIMKRIRTELATSIHWSRHKGPSSATAQNGKKRIQTERQKSKRDQSHSPKRTKAQRRLFRAFDSDPNKHPNKGQAKPRPSMEIQMKNEKPHWLDGKAPMELWFEWEPQWHKQKQKPSSTSAQKETKAQLVDEDLW